VACATATDYRLVDTAAGYGNEREVGEAIARSGFPRPDLFVTTRLWITGYGYEQALRGFDASLRRLGLEYLDLYLLHWPVPSDFAATVASYRAMERFLAEGRVPLASVTSRLTTCRTLSPRQR
jgi:diketogulonate reductase-like aldo/keto reductase